MTDAITGKDKALALISGGLKGFVTVYQRLKAAGRILTVNCAQEGVKLIDRCYAFKMAQATSDGLEAVTGVICYLESKRWENASLNPRAELF